MTRPIKPHKGDESGPRSERFHGGLLTPKEKALLDEVLEDFGGSLSDWIMAVAQQCSRSLVYYSYQLPNGKWQAIASTDSIIEAVENCEFHAEGRPWVIADSSATIFELLHGA